MQIPMISTIRQNYDGRALKTGDEFNVNSENDAADLVAIRFATRKPGRPIVSPSAPVTRVVETASAEEPEARMPTEEEENSFTPPASGAKTGGNTQPRYPNRALNSRK